MGSSSSCVQCIHERAAPLEGGGASSTTNTASKDWDRFSELVSVFSTGAWLCQVDRGEMPAGLRQMREAVRLMEMLVDQAQDAPWVHRARKAVEEFWHTLDTMGSAVAELDHAGGHEEAVEGRADDGVEREGVCLNVLLLLLFQSPVLGKAQHLLLVHHLHLSGGRVSKGLVLMSRNTMREEER